MTILQKEPSSLIDSYKFMRRADISFELRMKLGVLLACFQHHGQVTNFSNKYGVSRSFLYDLKHRAESGLSACFAVEERLEMERSERRFIAWRAILRLRCIGKCSLSAISELLGLQDERLPNSTCFISQFLKTLGVGLGKLVNWQGKTHYGCDEIFMVGHQPVLVTVDPNSSAILCIEVLAHLSKEAWQAHWQRLIDAGIYPLGMVKDEGVAMSAAQAEFFVDELSDVTQQTDTFHAISHRLGLYARRLEKAADKAIEHEWDRQSKIQSAKKEEVIARRVAAYQAACIDTARAIEQFEGFQWLYFHILRQLNTFDSKGQVRQQQNAIQEVKVALELMRELQIPGLEEELQTIENLLPKLFNFLAKAQIVHYQLEADLGEIPTYFWTYAWQAMKQSRKMKNYAKSKAAAQRAQLALQLLAEHYATSTQAFEALKNKVFSHLDSIVQSSALVETINSMLRPYMNGAKNQLSQEQLNIIRFYLNHRVYQRGKRAGQAPIELLSGKKLEQSWCELLLEKAIQHD